MLERYVGTVCWHSMSEGLINTNLRSVEIQHTAMFITKST